MRSRMALSPHSSELVTAKHPDRVLRLRCVISGECRQGARGAAPGFRPAASIRHFGGGPDGAKTPAARRQARHGGPAPARHSGGRPPVAGRRLRRSPASTLTRQRPGWRPDGSGGRRAGPVRRTVTSVALSGDTGSFAFLHSSENEGTRCPGIFRTFIWSASITPRTGKALSATAGGSGSVHGQRPPHLQRLAEKHALRLPHGHRHADLPHRHRRARKGRPERPGCTSSRVRHGPGLPISPQQESMWNMCGHSVKCCSWLRNWDPASGSGGAHNGREALRPGGRWTLYHCRSRPNLMREQAEWARQADGLESIGHGKDAESAIRRAAPGCHDAGRRAGAHRGDALLPSR